MQVTRGHKLLLDVLVRDSSGDRQVESQSHCPNHGLTSLRGHLSSSRMTQLAHVAGEPVSQDAPLPNIDADLMFRLVTSSMICRIVDALLTRKDLRKRTAFS